MDFDDVQLMTLFEPEIKMAAIQEECMKNVSLSLYTRKQRDSNDQTRIFVVDEHNGTDVNNVRCRRESQFEDGRH